MDIFLPVGTMNVFINHIRNKNQYFSTVYFNKILGEDHNIFLILYTKSHVVAHALDH